MPETRFEFGSSIPVVRMLDEAETREFYIDYLGYEVDWEHRFSDELTSPLYMQVHQGESVLHLNGHADEKSPICEVRIPVSDLEGFCDYLNKKSSRFGRQEVVDPRYEDRKTDLNLLDPSGNHLVLWAPSHSG